MKLMLLILSLICFNLIKSQNVSVRFTNASGQQLDSLIIGAKAIGTLYKDSSTKVLMFHDLNFEMKKLLIHASAYVKNQKISDASMAMCDKEITKVKSGNYSFAIVLKPQAGKELLYSLAFLQVSK